MPRRPQIRVSYHNDMAFLIRMRDAIQRDEKRPQVWKDEAVAHIDSLTKLFAATLSPASPKPL